MNVLKKIREMLEELIPFIKKETKPADIINFKDIEPELTKITDKQHSLRKKVIKETKQNKILKLTTEQESLVIEKIKIINFTNSEQEYEEIRKLVYQIELLETNKLLQERIIFKIKQVDFELTEKLKSEIQTFEFQNEILSVLKKKHELKEANRKKEIIANNKLKESVLYYSLVKIHDKREEEKREKERIEKQRRLNELYNSHIEKAILFLNKNDFTKARELLDSALEVKPSKVNEIKRLQNKIEDKQRDYNKRKTEFKQLFEKAENKFHNGRFKKAIELFTQAQELDINNYLCKRRISDAQNKLERIKQREEERKRIKQEKKERLEKYKDDAQEILQIFEQNGIRQLYHFTDSRNKNSIIQNGGLFSWWYCEENNIPIYAPGGDMQSRELDRRQQLENYVRLSYTSNHPMAWRAQQDGRIINLKNLIIKIDVSTLRNTKFSNVNAARTSTPPIAVFGEDVNFIRNNVKFNVVKRSRSPKRDDPDFPYFQAEVMVKEHVPLEYITNL